MSEDSERLWQAVANDDGGELRRLLRKQPMLRERPRIRYGGTPLYEAVVGARTKVVRVLVEEAADIFAPQGLLIDRGATPWSAAIGSRRADILAILVLSTSVTPEKLQQCATDLYELSDGRDVVYALYRAVQQRLGEEPEPPNGGTPVPSRLPVPPVPVKGPSRS